MQLLERLTQHATDRPGALAYRDASTGAAMTWGELRSRVAELAGEFGDDEPGVVRIELPNTLDFPVAFLAALSAGSAPFPVSPVESTVVRDLVRDHLRERYVVDGRGIGLGHGRASADEVGQDLLLLSSGSTGVPKVVRRTGTSVDAVCAQMAGAIPIGPGDHVLATVPLCHSYGIEHGLLLPVWTGAAVTLCRGMDPAVVRRELAGSRVTVLPAVPAAFEALSRLDGLQLDGVTAYSAGGPLPPAVAGACRERLGLAIGQVYGATEIGSVTYGDGVDGTVGTPMPGVTIRTDDDGQVLVAAGSLFAGYLGEPNPTTPDGYYPTGDLGHLDDRGRLHVTGRVKLLIDVGGRKVNPLEVEAVLLEHPAVAGCAVVPVQQTDAVYRLKAVVELRAYIDVEELRAFARARLAPHKVPRMFEVRDALPRSSAGKVIRAELT